MPQRFAAPGRRSSTTRASGRPCSAGSATSIHDGLNRHNVHASIHWPKGGPSYEKVLTRKRGACGDARGTCNGGGYARGTSASASSLLRLVWCLYRWQHRRDLVHRQIKRSQVRGRQTRANNFSTSDNDGIFGFHAGAQWQWGAWVLGVEAALSGCINECRSLQRHLPYTSGLPHQYIGRAQDHQPVHGGPRIGYAWDRWMLFATGGWASANLKGSSCNGLAGKQCARAR